MEIIKQLLQVLLLSMLLVGCNNIDFEEKSYIKNNENLQRVPSNLIDITTDSSNTFLRLIKTSKSFYIITSSKTIFTVYAGDSLLFKRDLNDFYFENYLSKKDGISIRTYQANYIRKIKPIEGKEIRIEYQSIQTLNSLNHLTVSSEKPNYEKLNVSKLKLPVYSISEKSFIRDGEKHNAKLSTLNTKPVSEKKTTLEIRGQTSRSFPKKQFNINLKNFPELLNGSHKGVLYSPYVDRSLIRNVLAYRLGNTLGVDAPKTEFCHLIMNRNYEGIYVLLNKPEPSNLKTLIKIDDKETFTTPNKADNKELKNIPYQIISSKKSEEELVQIKHVVNLLESDDVLTIIDVPSFINYIILNELSRNIDAYRKSVYLTYNKANNKLFAGPLWDFDLAFGLPNYNDGFDFEGFVYSYPEMLPWMPFWWKELIENPSFHLSLKQRYTELRKTELSEQNMNLFIDKIVDELKGEQAYNFKKWDVLNATDFWPNHFTPKTHEAEINFIKTWLKQRLLWLDTQ